MPLEEYVLGVGAGEMPTGSTTKPSGHKRLRLGPMHCRITDGGRKPIEATVSAQVYKTAAERKERWGKEFKNNEKRLREVIATTAGDTIVHGDELITAMFFPPRMERRRLRKTTAAARSRTCRAWRAQARKWSLRKWNGSLKCR